MTRRSAKGREVGHKLEVHAHVVTKVTWCETDDVIHDGIRVGVLEPAPLLAPSP